MKISVLYLVNLPSPYRVSFFNELGRYCDLTVIFERYQADDREENWHDYNFYNFTAEFLNGIKVGADSIFDLSVLKKINKGYDLIVVGNYSTPTGVLAINYLNWKKIPFIINVDGGLIDHNESLIKKNIKTKLLSSATYWLSTGERTNDYLTYYGANQENIYIYPFTTLYEKDISKNVLSLEDKQNYRSELRIPYENVVLSVGQFIHRKGFDLLIKAAPNFIENTGVYIIGGEITKEYEEILETNKILNVHFIEFQEYNVLKKYYQSANIFVFPTREDIWGLVVNEAMANALPVITTTDCVAGVEMIEDGINGFLVSSNDIEGIVKYTNEILSDSNLQNNMAQNNISKSYEYTIEKMALRTYEVFLEILI